MKILALIAAALLLSAAVVPKEILMNQTVTAYCPCKICCGPNAPQPTTSGVWPTDGITVAGPRKYPFGTKVQIVIGTNVYNRVIQDRMSLKFPERWDIYMPPHDKALRWGKVTNALVRIY